MDPFKIFLNKIKLREEKTPKHFSSKEMPGQADDVFHDCTKRVKAEASKDGKDMTEQEAAAICTKSRKEGGATEKFGAKRKAEVDRKRKEDKMDEEIKVISREDHQEMLRKIGKSQTGLKKKVLDQIRDIKSKEDKDN